MMHKKKDNTSEALIKAAEKEIYQFNLICNSILVQNLGLS